MRWNLCIINGSIVSCEAFPKTPVFKRTATPVVPWNSFRSLFFRCPLVPRFIIAGTCWKKNSFGLEVYSKNAVKNNIKLILDIIYGLLSAINQNTSGAAGNCWCRINCSIVLLYYNDALLATWLGWITPTPYYVFLRKSIF